MDKKLELKILKIKAKELEKKQARILRKIYHLEQSLTKKPNLILIKE